MIQIFREWANQNFLFCVVHCLDQESPIKRGKHKAATFTSWLFCLKQLFWIRVCWKRFFYHRCCYSIHLSNCMEYSWGPFCYFDLFVNCHSVMFFFFWPTNLSLNRLFGILNNVLTLCKNVLSKWLSLSYKLWDQVVIILLLLFYFVVFMRGMSTSLRVCTPVRLFIKALVHEIRYPFISKVVHHFYLNLLQYKVSLFFAFSLRLLLKTDLRSIHLNFSNLVLIVLWSLLTND